MDGYQHHGSSAYISLFSSIEQFNLNPFKITCWQRVAASNRYSLDFSDLLISMRGKCTARCSVYQCFSISLVNTFNLFHTLGGKTN